MKYLNDIFIGCYLKSIEDNLCGTISNIFADRKEVSMIIRGVESIKNIEKVEPIILDKDWLYFLGFNSHNDTEYFECNPPHKFRINIEIKGHEVFLTFRPTLGFNDERRSIIKIYYVHQLQYFYFMLTDNELKIVNFKRKPAHNPDDPF